MRANSWRVGGVVLVLALLVALIMQALVKHFGRDEVLSYASLASVAASIVLAMLTGIYVFLTSEIAKAGRENSKTTLEMVAATKKNSDQQARVADLMEKDLRERVAPFLTWRFEGGPTSAMPCRLVNSGKGVAINVTVHRQDKGFETPILGPEVLAPNHDVRLTVPSDMEFRVTCEDSIGMARYTWRYGSGGKLISYSQDKI